MLGVALDKFRLLAGQGGFRRIVPLGGDVQHLRTEIEPGHFRPAFGEGKGNVAGAAAQIQRLIPGMHLREIRYAPLPAPVQAETLEVVDQIVTAGDTGEEVINLRGALLAGHIISVAHSPNETPLESIYPADKQKLQNALAKPGRFATIIELRMRA